MPKNYYCKKVESGRAYFDEHEINHMKVMRIGIGSVVNFTDGHGFLYEGEIDTFNRKEATAAVLKKTEYDVEPIKKVHLFISNTKWPRESILLEKAVELGVSSINFFNSERSQKRENKEEKINFLIRKALKQCGGTFFPNINFYESIHNLILEKETRCLKFFLDPAAPEAFSSSVITVYDSFSVFVGPEGGFSVEETNYLKSAGILGYNIGSRILRSETAVISVLSLIILS